MSETHHDEMTYGNNVLSPAPMVSIKTDLNYSGDSVIGYTHTLSLRGYATSYNKSIDGDAEISVTGIKKVLDNISRVKTILTNNGKNLILYDSSGVIVLKAKGGILRSLSFGESPNNWMGYSEYTAELEFNEVELMDGANLKTIQCSSSFLKSDSLSSNLVDINKYKIKTFNDTWNISTDDNLYNRVLFENLDIDNSSINISYTVSATGKHFFINGNLRPAWEQAKNFAQDRLYKQISNMLEKSLGLDASTACAASEQITDHGTLSKDGLLNNLYGSYKIFNETISCETSESEGSFSATYNAIIKKVRTSTYSSEYTKHTISKTFTKDHTRNNTNISIQGTIEGLVLGGLIETNYSGFSLPQNGAIIIANASNISTKYSNAQNCLNNKILTTEKDDIKIGLKSVLGITYSELSATAPSSGGSDGPKPSSINLTHDYHNGIITYNMEYSTVKTFGGGDYASINISIEKPIPVLAELNIPHNGVLIQDIGTRTAGKINITIEGKRSRVCCFSGGSEINNELLAMSFSAPVILPSYINLTNYILTQKTRSDNLTEGTYTVNLGYVCTNGCPK